MITAQGKIRAAGNEDLSVLIEIEVAAGELFRSLALHFVADDDPPSLDDLARYAQSGRAYVSVDVEDRPVGYLLLDVVDAAAHIEQVSVHPAHQRQGNGRALIKQAVAWARDRDFKALTLTTYVDVPWNGTFYERLGFAYLTPEEETPGLRAIRENERAHGLDQWQRACMRLDIRPLD